LHNQKEYPDKIDKNPEVVEANTNEYRMKKAYFLQVAENDQ